MVQWNETDVKTEVKDTHFASKAYGQRDSKETGIDGRLQLDILQVMQRDYKLRSYTLNSVCAHFLGASLPRSVYLTRFGDETEVGGDRTQANKRRTSIILLLLIYRMVLLNLDVDWPCIVSRYA